MQWLRNLKIVYKISLIALFSGASFFAYVALNYQVATENAERIDLIGSRYFPRLERCDANITRLDKIQDLLGQSVSSDEPDMVDTASALAEEVRTAFSEIGHFDPDAIDRVQKLELLFDDYFNQAQTMTLAMLNGDMDLDSMRSNAARMSSSLEIYRSALLAFHEDSNLAFDAMLEKVNGASKDAAIFGLWAGALLMLIIGFITWLVTSVISNNLHSLIATLKDMASGKGDLTNRLPLHSTDELGELVQWFNKLVDKLQSLIQDVITSTDEVTKSADAMSTITEETNTSVQVQMQGTSQLAAAIHELGRTMDEVSNNATQTSVTATETALAARAGQDIVDGAIKAIQHLASEVDKVTILAPFSM